jgi:hypothetical protein
MSRRSEVEAMYGHPLQYAFVGHLRYPHDPLVLDTENLSDDQVLDKLAMSGDLLHREQHMLAHRQAYRFDVERYNRCPTCEQWSPCDVRRAEVRETVSPGGGRRMIHSRHASA